MADLSNLVAVLQRKIKEREAKIRTLEEQIQAASKQVEQQGADEENLEYQQRLFALESENAQLKEDLAAIRGASTGTTAKPVNDLVQELQRKIKKKDEEIARLKTGRKESEQPAENQTTYQQKISELSAEIQQLQSALANEKGKVGNDKKLAQLESTVKELETIITAKENEILNLKENTPPSKAVSEDVERLTGEISSFANEKKKLEGEIEILRTQATKSQVEVEELQSQLQLKNQLEQTLQEEIRTLKDQLTSMESKLNEGSTSPSGTPGAAQLASGEGKKQLLAEELTFVDSVRWVCPKCNNNNRSMIREEEDKTLVLSVAPLMYGKKLICGVCGWKWHR